MDEQLAHDAQHNKENQTTSRNQSAGMAGAGANNSGAEGGAGHGAEAGSGNDGTLGQAVSVARDMTDQARSMAADAGSRAQEMARRAGDSLYEQGSRAGQYVSRGMDEYPFAALLVAGAIGYGLAYLIHNQWSAGSGWWSGADQDRRDNRRRQDQGRHERQDR